MKITRRSVPVKAAINKLPAGIKPADTPVKDYAEELASAVCKSLTDNGYICEYKVSTKSIVFTVAVDTNADIDINFTLPLSAIVPEATVSADMATVVDKIMNLAPLTSPGTDVDLTAEVTSATKVVGGYYETKELDDEELDLLYEIADRYNVSSPVSGSWDTETEHEQEAISAELGVSKDQARDIMIEYLGFDESQFGSKPYLSGSTKICADQYRQYHDPEILKRQIEDITAEYEARKAAGNLSEDEAWAFEQEIQEYKDELRFAYEDQEYDVDGGTCINCSTDISVTNYLNDFGDATIEALWSGYGIKAKYEVHDDNLTVYFYSAFRSQKPWTHVTRSYDELNEIWGNDPISGASAFADELVVRTQDIDDEMDIEGATGVESFDDKDPILGSYKNDEAYKKLLEYDYILDTSDDGCVIKFSDGDPYATFRFVTPTEEELADGLDEWLIYADGDLINERLDYYPTNYDEAVKTAIRYFWSHY